VLASKMQAGKCHLLVIVVNLMISAATERIEVRK
jgi:hypothetical protein